VEKVNQILDRCENAAADETKACLMLIRRYLAADNRDAAIATARECLQHARRRTRACVAAVREVCTRCIDYLLLVGADRLAARVRNACADAIDHLERLYQRQENAIKGAMGV
jgi:hypothetical protein